MEEKLVKLENIKTKEFTINFPLPNGHIKPYMFHGVRGKRRDIVSVPEEVYEWLRYETSTFQKGYLVLATEENDELIKQEMKDINPIIYTVEQIETLLKGNISKLKKEINETTPKEVVQDFVRVAKEIKIDSDSVKTYLATLLGHKDSKEIIFS